MRSVPENLSNKISSVLACPDRLIFKGHLLISSPQSMEALLYKHGVLIKDFKHFVESHSQAVRLNAQALAQKTGRPFIKNPKRKLRKDDEALKIAQRDGLKTGLICVFSVLESCNSFRVVPGPHRPRLEKALRKCLFFYFYFLDPEFGFIHVRIQSWFPFTIQIYLNCHEWLARKMDRCGLKYTRADNAFLALQDPSRSQRLADNMSRKDWSAAFEPYAQRVNPHLPALLQGLSYDWYLDEFECSLDLLFKDRACLREIYPHLLRHAFLAFGAEDLLGFLGKKLHGNFKGEVLTDLKKRSRGWRIKHNLHGNWLKMYDKHGSILRLECTINRPRQFKVRRWRGRPGARVLGWFPMLKRAASFPAFAGHALSACQRYLNALAVAVAPAPTPAQALQPLCEPVSHSARRHRGLNPLLKRDANLFSAVLRGEYFLNGFRNKDVAAHLYPCSPADPAERKRQSARITRLLQLLRAHALIIKIPKTRKYRLAPKALKLIPTIRYLHLEPMPYALPKTA